MGWWIWRWGSIYVCTLNRNLVSNPSNPIRIPHKSMIFIYLTISKTLWAWAFCSLPHFEPCTQQTCWVQWWIQEPIGDPGTHREFRNPSWIQETIVNPGTHRESKNPHPQWQKTWCQETLCHLSQGAGWYLASWSCLCNVVLRHGGGGCLSTALHRHGQLAEYNPVPWLRWHNVSWHQIFRLPDGWASICPEMWSSDICDMSSTSGYIGEKLSFRNLVPDFSTCPRLGGTWGKMFRD